MESMIIFGVLQFINVILGTLRSICTIKAGRHVGMIMNVIAFTFYAAVVKLTGAQELWFVVVVTAITNCIGFYIAEFIFRKAQKDKLWRISCTYTVKHANTIGYAHNIEEELNRYNLSYNMTKVDNNKTIFDIYSYSQGESALAKEIIHKFHMKYHVIEMEKKL